MASKSKSKQEQALQFLDDLDSMSANSALLAQQKSNSTSGENPAPARSTQPVASGGDAEALAFIDEITRKSSELSRPHIDRPLSRSGTPTLRKSTERVRVGGAPPSSSSTLAPTTAPSQEASDPNQAPDASSSWGWGSVWSSASAAIQQARTVVDEQVKHLPKNEQARKWGEGVMEYAKTAQLDKIGADFKRVGLSTLSDILNVVAPPISEHEVIQIWLTHDMVGHDGIENLVYRAMGRIMEQVEGGDLVVTRGEESKPKDGASGRNLNTVDGYDAAMKLAQAEIDSVIKANAGKTKQSEPSAVQSPTTYSHVYLRIQPFISTFASPERQTTVEDDQPSASQLQFLLVLSDPVHEVVRYVTTQSLPSHWIGVWEKYDWVEDHVAESLRAGVETMGQEYLVARMGWIRDIPSIQEEEHGDIKEPDVVVVDSKAS